MKIETQTYSGTHFVWRTTEHMKIWKFSSPFVSHYCCFFHHLIDGLFLKVGENAEENTLLPIIGKVGGGIQ